MSLENLLNRLRNTSFERLFDLSGRKAIVTGGGGVVYVAP